MNIANIFSAVATLSWLLVIGIIVVAVLRASRGQRLKNATTLIIGAVVVALLLTAISAGLVFVQPQERGVVVSAVPGQQGVRAQALDPGLRWIIPFFETVIPYPISRQTYTMSGVPTEGQIQGDDSVQARTSDGQIVFVDASVIFAINPTRAVDVHVRWQNNYVDNLIRPQSRGIIRDAVSQFGVEEVYSVERDTVTQLIEQQMEFKLAEEGLQLVDFVLRNISFSAEYADSVEQKQIAEQQAQQAAFVVEQRKQEAEQARQQAQGLADAAAIRADGEARAILINAQAEADARLVRADAEATALEMLGQAISTNSDVLTLEYIQRLSPNIRVMLLPSGSPLLLPLPEAGELDVMNLPETLPAPTPEPTPTATSP